MWLHDVEGTGSNGEDVVAAASIAMIPGQSIGQTIRLKVVVQQSKEIAIADVLHAPGDLDDPLLQPILVHLH